MLFQGCGDREQRVALSVIIKRGLIRAANQFSKLFQSPRRAASPLDPAHAAGGHQSAAPPARHEHVKSVAANDAPTFVNHRVSRLGELQVAVHILAEP